jgi:chromosome segregation ATPase
MATATDATLWRLIESRDRAFSGAHAAFQSLTREAREKDEEIVRLKAAATEKDEEITRLKAAATGKDEEIALLKAATTEKDVEIHEKEEEIQMLARAATERLGRIEQIQGSREYKAGVTLLHPWRVLRRKR